MLRASELASMRATVNSTFPDKCDVLSVSGTADGLGAFNNTPTVLATYGCRFVPSPTGKDEIIVGETVTSVALATLILPYSAVINASNRVRMKATGAVYEVAAANPAGAEDLSRSVDLRLVNAT